MRRILIRLDRATSVCRAASWLLGLGTHHPHFSVQQWASSWPELPSGPYGFLWELELRDESVVCPFESPGGHTPHVHTPHVHHTRQRLSSGAPFSGHTSPQACHRTQSCIPVHLVLATVLGSGWCGCSYCCSLWYREALSSPDRTVGKCQPRPPVSPAWLFRVPLESPCPGEVPGNNPVAPGQRGQFRGCPLGPISVPC